MCLIHIYPQYYFRQYLCLMQALKHLCIIICGTPIRICAYPSYLQAYAQCLQVLYLLQIQKSHESDNFLTELLIYQLHIN